MCLAHLFKGSVVLTQGKILIMFLFLLLKGIFSDNFLFSFIQGIKSSNCRLEIDGMYLFAMICDCKKSKAMNCGQYASHDSCETKKFFFHYPWYMTLKCFFFFFVNKNILVTLSVQDSLWNCSTVSQVTTERMNNSVQPQ